MNDDMSFSNIVERTNIVVVFVVSFILFFSLHTNIFALLTLVNTTVATANRIAKNKIIVTQTAAGLESVKS